jgi:2-keto-4-pentenoate hydratase/2-oxohepta-3-ene-1,7-dioic acid hydratase in catechol pathway
VTADELDAYRDDEGFLQLDMRVSVNGTEVGQDLLSNMSWTFEELISYASRGTWVNVGDVLGSGTCGNGLVRRATRRRGIVLVNTQRSPIIISRM